MFETTAAAAENSGNTSGGSTYTSESSSLRSLPKNSGDKSSRHQMIKLDRATLELAITEHNRDDEEEEAISLNRSRLFLFACCDIRMGSIIMNAANIIVVVLVIVLLLPSSTVEVNGNDNALFHSYLRNSLMLAVSLLFGIPGAWFFQKHMVGLVTIFFLGFAVWGIVDGRLLGSLFNAFMVYPNGHLFWALHTGTLTFENYPNTKRWCC